MTTPSLPRVPPARAALRRDPWTWILGAIALTTAANALWMLVAPLHWYHELPADVPAAGPYNEHFVRDIGCAFAVMALAFGWAALRPVARVPLVVIASVFLVAHAALHVFDSWRGYLPPGHWHHDVAIVYVPAVAAIAMIIALLRAHPRRNP